MAGVGSLLLQKSRAHRILPQPTLCFLILFSQPYRRKRTMELNNGASVILILALSSLLSFSANAFCVTRNDTEFHAPASSFAPMLHHVSVAPSASPPQSSSASPPQSSSSSPPQSSSSSPPTESESESTPPPTESESTPPPTESESESTPPPTESESESTPPPTESESESTPSPTESTQTLSTPVPLDSEEESGEQQNDAVALTNLLTETSLSVSSATELVKICDVTSNPQLCSKSISTELESTGKDKGSGPEVNSVSALKSEIQASIDEVKKALAKVEALRKDSSVSNTEIECLDVCKENFGSALDDLKTGLESIDAHDIGKMESVLTAVLTNVVTCDDTFAEMGVESPLDDLTNKMNRYASNCLAISKLLM